MKELQELMQEYREVHPIFDHFGLFTADRDKATAFLLTVPGSRILSTRDVRFPAEQVTIGKPVTIRIHHVEVCGLDIEVIEPLDSPESYIEHIVKTHGESFHHIALTFEQHKEHLSMCRLLEAGGYRCVFEATVRDLLIHYYESSEDSAITLELKSVRD